MKRLRIWHRFEEKASDCISSLAVFAFFSLWHLVLVGIKSSNEYTLAFICELFSCTAECPHRIHSGKDEIKSRREIKP
jgi:hypothetical protein